MSQPIESSVITATERIRQETGCSLGFFGALKALFWPEHKGRIPDLILHFHGNQPRSVVILIEAKLYAAKSGTGEQDQLASYLRILDSLQDLRPPLPSDALALAVYLTATDSRSEIIESLSQYGDCEQARPGWRPEHTGRRGLFLEAFCPWPKTFPDFLMPDPCFTVIYLAPCA